MKKKKKTQTYVPHSTTNNLTKQNCRVLTIVECTWELKTTYQKSINIQLGQ